MISKRAKGQKLGLKVCEPLALDDTPIHRDNSVSLTLKVTSYLAVTAKSVIARVWTPQPGIGARAPGGGFGIDATAGSIYVAYRILYGWRRAIPQWNVPLWGPHGSEKDSSSRKPPHSFYPHRNRSIWGRAPAVAGHFVVWPTPSIGLKTGSWYPKRSRKDNGRGSGSPLTRAFAGSEPHARTRPRLLIHFRLYCATACEFPDRTGHRGCSGLQGSVSSLPPPFTTLTGLFSMRDFGSRRARSCLNPPGETAREIPESNERTNCEPPRPEDTIVVIVQFGDYPDERDEDGANDNRCVTSGVWYMIYDVHDAVPRQQPLRKTTMSIEIGRPQPQPLAH
ncbi:hypothetical protein HD554DRAFT_2329618 [Boletus coccyginus]|nr:hypothetical protein HD554DRAFT_2329618 [Boletus coccyginus]